MKTLVIVVLISLFGNFSGVQAREGILKPQTEIYSSAKDIRTQAAVVDCTVRVNFTTDEGTRIEGELTFVDIPWWECAAIKVGNFLSKIF